MRTRRGNRIGQGLWPGILMHVVADHRWWLWFGLILTVPMGAFAGSHDLEAGRKHWAFQPVISSDPPGVKRAAWVKTPIDAFVLSALEAKGLTPAPVAEKRA